MGSGAYYGPSGGGGSGSGGNFANSLGGMTYAGQIASNQAKQNFGYNKDLAQQGYQSAAGISAANNASQQGMNAANNATQQQGNQLQYQSSILGPTLKQQRFNQVLPMFQNELGSLNSTNGGGSQVGTPPKITQGGVYTPGQIQQQVNSSRAATDQATAGQVNQMQGQVAGRGFGANSPLAAALGQNMQSQGLATNTANETNTRMTAAQQNATQNLAGQTEAQNQFNDVNNQAIERKRTQTTALSAWLGSLGGLAS